MKKALLIISLLVMVGLMVLAMTKPDGTEHYDALKKTVARVVDRELHANPQTAEFATLGIMSTLNMVDEYLSMNLMVQDHTFYTTGVLRYQGFFFPVSIGVLGQVHLTINDDDLRDALMKLPEIKEMMKTKSLEEAVRLYLKKK